MSIQPDLRERRRRATQAEIEDAAIGLFERQGFDRTTVDEIAAAAGVSPSTFFRHFPTKEDTASGANRAFEAALTARRDAFGPGVPRLRDVEAVVADALEELVTARADVTARMVRVRRVVMGDAVLRGAMLRREVEQCERFVRLLSPSAGEVDPAVRMLAELVSSGLRITFDEWAARQGQDGGPGLVEVYRGTCSLLRTAVSD
ncbi:TetR family transcriptional regulator [Streptomyces sp. NPDC004539]|uniref:TetR/AcrR family transcriptional regulator n=1 Tax=Streptomyces sp. NPDC004539 TaxID=3154280 RepID=UPI0033A6BE74